MQIEVAAQVGQLEIEEFIGLFGLPEQQVAAVVPAAGADHKTRRDDNCTSSTGPLSLADVTCDCFFSPVSTSNTTTSGLPRPAKALVTSRDTAASQQLAVAAKAHAAHAADVGAESLIVFPQSLGIELPQLLAAFQVPFASRCLSGRPRRAAGRRDESRRCRRDSRGRSTVPSSAPSSAFQSFTRLSLPPVASSLPSGLTATARTQP